MSYDPVAEHLEYEKRKPYYRQYYQERQESRKDYQKTWRRNNRAYKMWDNAKQRAKRQVLPFTITVEDIVIPETCPIFGTPLIWSETPTNDMPTLERIIPALGYVPGNIAVISFRANRIKNDASLAELKQLVAWLESL